ncbi:MAG: hypothetical protein AAGJ79_10725, partial [Verrucomicrobiota bacterium]
MKLSLLLPFTLTISSIALQAGEISLLDYNTKNPGGTLESNDFWTPSRPDGHAPIGVMADHMHDAGEIMVSFRYGFGHMTTNHLGDSEISDRRIITPKAKGGEGFTVTPTKMDMHMWMPGIMYAPTDRITLMLMAPYVYKTMDHLRRDGKTFTTESDGFGDLKFTPMVKLYDANRRAAHLGLGFSAPTGSIDEEDFVPGPGQTRLPYPMQLGSGTWDLLPSLTWLGQSDHFSWGAQANGTIRLGTNDEGYSLGDGWSGTTWGAAKVTDALSLSARATYSNWGNIDGTDRGLVIPAAAVPTADPNLRGGERVDLSFGFNIYKQQGALEGHRLGVELGFPVYENLDG